MSKVTREAAAAGIKLKISPDDINKTIDEAVDAFVAERYAEGIEAIEELAHWYKTAGCSGKTFQDLCVFIENEVGEITGQPQVTTNRIRKAASAHIKAVAEGRQRKIILPSSVSKGDLLSVAKKSRKLDG